MKAAYKARTRGKDIVIVQFIGDREARRTLNDHIRNVGPHPAGRGGGPACGVGDTGVLREDPPRRRGLSEAGPDRAGINTPFNGVHKNDGAWTTKLPGTIR
jgi:hypothetical protein